MEIEHILFFTNKKTQYDVLHSFRKSLSASLQKLGVQISTIDFSQANESLLPMIYRNLPDCTFAFNGLSPLPGNYFLADKLEIPHVAWLVDAAHYFYEYPRSPYNIIISPDQTSCDQMKKWGSEHSFFLPHAFEASLKTDPRQERKYPLVFLGTCIDPLETEENWKTLPKNVRQSLFDLAEQVMFVPSLTVQEGFEKVKVKHADYFKTQSEEMGLFLWDTFDGYIRAKDRLALLNALREFPIHIFGNSLTPRSWGDFLDLKKGNYTLHAGVSFDEAIQIMRQSQIVLNSSPMFKQGAHERIFYGLGLGALVLTNETPWLTENLSETLTYRHDQWSKTIEALKMFLSNPEKRIEKVIQGQEKVLKNHTWDHRARQLIGILQEELEKY